MTISNDGGMINLINLDYTALKDNITITNPNLSGLVIPDLTLTEPTQINNNTLTTGIVGGTGAFDKLMESIGNHLLKQVEDGRINYEQYSGLYIQAMQTAMGTAVQFVIEREKTYYANMLILEQVRQGKVNTVVTKANLEIAKFTLQKTYLETHTANANYSLVKMQLANTNADYLIKDLQINTVIPKQNLILDGQKANLDKDLLVKQEQIDTSIKQQALLDEQIDLTERQVEIAMYTSEAERAKTFDTHTTTWGSTSIGGLLGKDIAIKISQKELYDQQKQSYILDAKYKLVQSSLNTWTVQRTDDDGLPVPSELTNEKISEIVGQYRTNVGFTG